MALRYDEYGNAYNDEGPAPYQPPYEAPAAPSYAAPAGTVMVGEEDSGGQVGTSTGDSVTVADGGQDTVSPWAIAPPDGDWAAWFLRNVQGMPASPDSLAALEAKLKLHGIELIKNASGKPGKIKIPGVGIKDVGFAFSSGDPSKMKWQFIDAAEAGAESDIDDWYAQNAPPMEAFTSPARPDYLQGEYKPPTWQGGEFVAPDAAALQQDPGYQARLAAAQKGFERSAAAKGTILSGGSQVALGRQQQELASNEYANAFGRAYDTYRQKYGQFQDSLTAATAARGMNENAYQSDVTNALNQYGTRYRTYRDSIDDQFRLSDLGLRATAAGAPA